MSKSTVIALGVLAILIVATVAVTNQTEERGITRVDFSAIAKDTVDTLVISGSNSVDMKKKDGVWVVADTGKDVDSTMIERALDTVNKIVSSDLVTRNTERFEELGVDDAKGTKVSARVNSQTVAEFSVGSSANGATHVLVDGGVYAVKGVSKSAFDRAANAWLDRRIFRGRPAADAEKVSVKLQNGGSFELVQKDNVWALADPTVAGDGFRFDPNSARSFVTSIVNLRAKDVLVDEPQSDPGTGTGDVFTIVFKKTEEAPAATVALSLGNDVPAEGDGQPDAVYAAVDARSAETVTVSKAQADNLRRGVERLRDLRVMDFDPAKITAVAISAGRDKVSLAKADGTWQLAKHSEKKPEGFEFDPSSAERRLRAIANTRATEIAEVSELESGLRRPSATVELTDESGATFVLRFGKEIEDDGKKAVFVAGNADGRVYRATPWTRDNVAGTLESFKKAAPSPAGMGGLGNLDPKTLQNLPPEIRQQLMRQMQQQQQQQQMMQELQAQN